MCGLNIWAMDTFFLCHSLQHAWRLDFDDMHSYVAVKRGSNEHAMRENATKCDVKSTAVAQSNPRKAFHSIYYMLVLNQGNPIPKWKESWFRYSTGVHIGCDTFTQLLFLVRLWFEWPYVLAPLYIHFCFFYGCTFFDVLVKVPIETYATKVPTMILLQVMR